MVLFNHAAHQMAAKIVYYGPGLCGKTTNLSVIYEQTAQKARGEMVSLNTDTDRTLFFDLLPLNMGSIWGFRAKLQLYTIPGQVFYNATRKMVLKGADGIVFVADSQAQMLDANEESLKNLELNLQEVGLDPQVVPMVFQWNKRDLASALPVARLEEALNPHRRPSFASIACRGTGVFETLRGIARETLIHLKARHFTPVGEPIADPLPAPAEASPAPTAAPPQAEAPPKPVPKRLPRKQKKALRTAERLRRQRSVQPARGARSSRRR